VTRFSDDRLHYFAERTDVAGNHGVQWRLAWSARQARLDRCGFFPGFGLWRRRGIESVQPEHGLLREAYSLWRGARIGLDGMAVAALAHAHDCGWSKRAVRHLAV